jgi:O-Antigen ligase
VKIPGARPSGVAPAPARSGPSSPLGERLLLVATGVWVALGFLKFGNPIVLNHIIEPPKSPVEFVFFPWPFGWGCWLGIGLALWGLARTKLPAIPLRRWIFWCPLAWFAWQLVAGASSIAPRLSNPTLVHFAVCVGAFYFGCLVLSRCRDDRFFWIPILLGFGWALMSGLDQHYGGLEAARQAVYERANVYLYPKEYLLRVSTGRIFSTLVYPNAFAGLILLLFPILAAKLAEFSAHWPKVFRGVVLGLFAYTSLACLYWTGSKGGWLLAIGLVGLALLHLPAPRRLKVGAVVAIALLGLGGFMVKYGAYFKRGAPSVGARFDYWSAAWQTAKANPWVGTGPGTFAVPYAKIKPPEAEMARLVHNDYLEQASDSGWLGLILYSIMISSIWFSLYRERNRHNQSFSFILLGIFGWIAQGLMEFGLYIPGLAWPVFLLLGWGYGRVMLDNPENIQR